ncbi:hypothetical protein KOR42_08800 [Thalassoglobus neptunius]|uniref:Uncharacterized protein n=1 Tax=Thalassoglobus neptunius TaxID=1938619 RepID=A0A5C5X4L3_9PLAN|nr:hypothetical protein KOR42_08800 [Thalassoglobus neptunius]
MQQLRCLFAKITLEDCGRDYSRPEQDSTEFTNRKTES